MAVNLNTQAVVNAAGAAYTPAEGEFDLWSGYIEGVGHVAAGLVKRREMVNKIKSSMDKISVPTDIPFIKDLAQDIKNDAINLTISEGEAQKQLNELIVDVKQYLPAINARLAEIDKHGLSKGVNRIDENYSLGLSLGELDAPITFTKDGVSKNMGTFFSVNPETRQLIVAAPNGDYFRPSELLARTENMPTANLGDETIGLWANFIGTPFLPGKTNKWASARDEINTKLNKLFANKKVLYSALLDNPMGFDVTNNATEETKTFTWEEHYLDSGLTDIQKATYDYQISLIGANETDKTLRAEMQEEAKSIILKGLMDDDSNLMTDVKDFANKIYEFKKPGDEEVITIVSKETPSGFKMKGKLTQSQSQDLTVVNTLENMLHIKGEGMPTKIYEDGSDYAKKGMGGKVLLVRIKDDEDGHMRYQFRQNMYGEVDGEGDEKIKNLSNSFNYPLSDDGYKTIMQQVITNVPNGVSYGSRVYNQFDTHLEGLKPTTSND